jgi:DNA (cytosine-5)-methyltransferase 1
MAIPILSLFCGCGGFDLGFVQAGFKVALALDIDRAAVNSYNHNHPWAVAQECDLSNATGRSVIELLRSRAPRVVPRGVIGGSPCQTFSSGNVHVKSDDLRHGLPKKYAAILKEFNEQFRLDFFVFENVRGITYQKHRDTFAEFKALFEDAGFRLFEGLLDAVDFGVPQHRPRMFVVGLNKEKYPAADFTFPTPTVRKPRTVGGAIRTFPEPVFFERGIKGLESWHHPNHWTMQPRSKKFTNGFLKEGQCEGRSFRVLAWEKPSWTVAYGNREIHIHPNGTRRLSVFEAMTLQGLPDWYELKGNLSEQIRQVSDAVPWQVGNAIATELKRTIGRRRKI